MLVQWSPCHTWLVEILPLGLEPTIGSSAYQLNCFRFGYCWSLLAKVSQVPGEPLGEACTQSSKLGIPRQHIATEHHPLGGFHHTVPFPKQLPRTKFLQWQQTWCPNRDDSSPQRQKIVSGSFLHPPWLCWNLLLWPSWLGSRFAWILRQWRFEIHWEMDPISNKCGRDRIKSGQRVFLSQQLTNPTRKLTFLPAWGVRTRLVVR